MECFCGRVNCTAHARGANNGGGRGGLGNRGGRGGLAFNNRDEYYGDVLGRNEGFGGSGRNDDDFNRTGRGGSVYGRGTGRGGFGQSSSRGFSARAPLSDDPLSYGNITRLFDDQSTTIKWRIPDIKTTYLSHRFYCSEKFKLFNDQDIEGSLFLDATKTFGEKGIIGLSIQDGKSAVFDIRFWLESGTGIRFNDAPATKHETSSPVNQIDMALEEKDKLMLRSCMDENQMVILCCKMQHQSSTRQMSPAHHDIGSKLWELYQEGLGQDAVIKADDKEFKVLSAVFMSQSDSFKQMFSNKDKTATMDGVSTDVMEAFICWMYTGQLVDQLIVDDLYVVADKYKIEALKDDCANVMIRNLTEENAAKRLAMASTMEKKDLEGKVMSFICQLEPKKIKHLFESNVWFKYAKALPQNKE